MYDQALKILEDYYDSLFLPTKKWPRYELEHRLAERFVVKDIIRILTLREKTQPVVNKEQIRQIIDDYIWRADAYSTMSHVTETIFANIRDAAHEVLDLFVYGPSERGI